MAPDLAIKELRDLGPNSIVLDPMAGSGTVVRHASELGFQAFGYDVDPLAVLMARAWTTPVLESEIMRVANAILEEIRRTNLRDAPIPWIDEDNETGQFVAYWFGRRQRNDLRKIAYVLDKYAVRRRQPPTRPAIDVLKVALSRIIITKDQGASLGRDVSHSRPHKVADTSDFDVMAAFEQSISYVRRILAASPPQGRAHMQLGDARSLVSIRNSSVDAVLTSPPYLNAIDYMRGHRLSLVWLGHRLSTLRRIRSHSVGAERGPDSSATFLFEGVQRALGIDTLSSLHRAIVTRYAEDVYRLTSEIARVLKPTGRAILVVGNSCLKGTFIRNSDGVTR